MQTFLPGVSGELLPSLFLGIEFHTTEMEMRGRGFLCHAIYSERNTLGFSGFFFAAADIYGGAGQLLHLS